MALYNTRASIAHTDSNELYLFRNIDNKIIMDYYMNDDGKQETVVEEALGEFDVLINEDDEIYLIYQDKNHNLNIMTIQNEIIENVKLTEGEMPKIYELNISQVQGYLNIIYVVLKSSKDGIFEIHHHLLDGERWLNYVIEEIKVDKFLNPIKILEKENSILICYYYENQICVKEFNLETKEWQESIILTDNSGKLYMDIILEDNHIHLAYCQYENENLMVKYARYHYDENSIVMEAEYDISNKGNPSNPTLIIEGEKMWIVWNESSKLLSRYSEDKGLNWSSIYLWKKSRFTDMIRYKYISNDNDSSIKLDYGFGTIHPDIQFLGFGPLNDVEEQISKKKVLQNMLRF